MNADKQSQLSAAVKRVLGGDCLSVSVAHDEVTVCVPRARIAVALQKLRDDPATSMTQLMDICGVDYPARSERFDVVYQLVSLSGNVRVRVKITTDETTSVPSVCGVYSAAGWFEREAWDLCGIKFSGHPDLRRILTDYDFEGHPLRKDFPLTGTVELRYDDEKKRVAYEPVKLSQEHREYDFLSPWAGEG